MDLVTVFEKFPTQQHCITHLEYARWGNEPVCPFCGSEKVARKKENDRVGRWNCHKCRNSPTFGTWPIDSSVLPHLDAPWQPVLALRTQHASQVKVGAGRHIRVPEYGAMKLFGLIVQVA